MTELKQKYTSPPNGDCQRTVFACLLGLNSVEEVPNFTEMEHFNKGILEWCNKNKLLYIEVSLEDFKKNWYPSGYCGVIGKSPRGDWDHIVIGEIKHTDAGQELHFKHDPSPLHDKIFLDDIKSVGFLARAI